MYSDINLIFKVRGLEFFQFTTFQDKIYIAERETVEDITLYEYNLSNLYSSWSNDNDRYFHLHNFEETKSIS